jgi:hypothetical protein
MGDAPVGGIGESLALVAGEGVVNIGHAEDPALGRLDHPDESLIGA